MARNDLIVIEKTETASSWVEAYGTCVLNDDIHLFIDFYGNGSPRCVYKGINPFDGYNAINNAGSKGEWVWENVYYLEYELFTSDSD